MERITDKKWLQNEKNLLGKTLCIIDRGSEDPIRFSNTTYIIDINRVEPDPMKNVDYLYGSHIFWVEDAPPMDDNNIPTLSRTDCESIDYFHPGVFENYEYYIMSREEAIYQIKEYNRQIINNLYKID